MLVAFHKPHGILSQFTSNDSAHRTLSEFNFPKMVYPLGRLDADSEGLLLLTDEAALNQSLLHPTAAHPRTYHALVERVPAEAALQQLREGVVFDGKLSLPTQAGILHPQPDFPPRNPPVRLRKTVSDVWIYLTLIEGRNRQVRKMTAAIGHPTLRLIRVQIGAFPLGQLAPGSWQELTRSERDLVLAKN